MKDNLEKARKEIARCDHLYNVSLKYTRTADTLKLIIKRLINSIDFAIGSLLEKLKSQEKIKQIPTLPRLRMEAMSEYFKDDEKIQQFVKFFRLLRKIDKAKSKCTQEFRRHVTMTCLIDDNEIEITIDIIGDYYKKTKEFVEYVENLLFEKKEE
ncbi:hypothetical protein KY314_01200 [Candidatus Woesearchaeota archaeon]|nr:hypothetical protein [Candidatus Woesearchaeota archaeon]